MVIVEFFDKEPIENMISAFANRPERVVLVGVARDMEKQDHIFRRFLKAAGNTATQLEYRGVRIHELSEIVKVLTQVVEDYPDCCFDLTGGDDLTMVAIGIVFERYREKGLELHQYNIRSGRIYDCDLNGNVLHGSIPDMTVEENIILRGGCIVSSDQRKDGTYDWDWNPDFTRDVELMWDLCRKEPGMWNIQITRLETAEKVSKRSEDPCELMFHMETAQNLRSWGESSYALDRFLYPLQVSGLITECSLQNGSCTIRFKNTQVRRCLTKAGTILELKTFMVAKSITGKDDLPLFNDVRTGVSIDWDGILHTKQDREVDTENEIDLILMNGLCPVFISCKNGAVDMEELYKLNTVTQRFGGKYAKKVLVATYLGSATWKYKDYLLQRANDMGIQVLSDVHKLTDKEFARKLRAMAS